jgi:hypothetical protein
MVIVKYEIPKMKDTDRFTFGKHKGETLLDVLESDPQYIMWAISEMMFTIDDDLQQHLKIDDHGVAMDAGIPY